MNRLATWMLVAGVAGLLALAGCPKDKEASKGPAKPPAPAAQPARPGDTSGVVYWCPMHHEVTSTNKDLPCPKCGMALVRRPAPTTQRETDRPGPGD